MTPTLADIRLHLAEHYGLTMAQVNELLRTPTHPAGMRDEFAMAAITGTLPGGSFSDDDVRNRYACWAYRLADAMLAERVK